MSTYKRNGQGTSGFQRRSEQVISIYIYIYIYRSRPLNESVVGGTDKFIKKIDNAADKLPFCCVFLHCDNFVLV